MLREYREAEEAKRKALEQSRPIARRRAPDKYVQIDPELAEQGVQYRSLGNGAYCQEETTFKARKYNRQRVLPPSNQGSNDVDPFDV
jgi:hypothetical protein